MNPDGQNPDPSVQPAAPADPGVQPAAPAPAAPAEPAMPAEPAAPAPADSPAPAPGGDDQGGQPPVAPM